MSNKKILLCDYLLSMDHKETSAQQAPAEPALTHPIKQQQMVVIEGDKILSTGPIPDKLPLADEVIHLKNHIVCPGLINTHTHLPMTLLKGIGDHLILKDWLEKVIFPLEKKHITPKFIQIGTELALLELIKGGTTTVCDMYFHTPVMAKLFEQYGLRGVLAGDCLSNFSDWEKDLEHICQQYQNSQHIYPALACHAPYTCSPKLLRQSAEEARARDLPLTIHVAETKWEIEEIKKQFGKTPVQHLRDLNVTGPKTLFAHGVHLTEQDMDIMAETKTSLSYNPESNMKLASGIAPILTALEKGITVGLGTDGSASNNNLNLWQEMDTAAKLQKLANPTKSVLSQDIFAFVTTAGAKALGLSDRIGKIAPGFLADIIALNLNHPHLYPRHDLLNNLVYCAHGGEVEFMMCHGNVLLKEGEILGVDTERVYALAEEQAKKLSF